MQKKWYNIFNILKDHNMDKIESRLRDIVVNQLGAKKSKVVPEAYFIEDLGADALDIVELVMRVEEEFDICISSEDAKLTTFGKLVEHVKSKIK